MKLTEPIYNSYDQKTDLFRYNSSINNGRSSYNHIEERRKYWLHRCKEDGIKINDKIWGILKTSDLNKCLSKLNRPNQLRLEHHARR